MKKIFAILLLLIAGLGLASCGEKGTVVTFWHTMGKTTKAEEGGQALLEKFIKEFEEANPGIKIKHESKGSYDDLASAVSKALVAGNQPTMSYSYTDHVAAYLRTGKVQSLDEFIDNPEYGLTAEEKADYVQAFLAEGRVFDEAGTLYSLPFSKSTEVMFYNKKFLKNHSFTELDGNNVNGEYTILNWDQAKALAGKINNATDLVSDFKGAFGYDSSNNHYITASMQSNIPYTSLPKGDNNGILFNNQEAKDMVKYFKNMYDAKEFTTKDMLGSNTSNFYLKEQIIFSIGSTGGTKYNIPAESDALFDPSEVGIAPIPFYGKAEDIEENYKAIQQGPNINLFQKKDKEEVIAAWKFLKYITAPEQQAQWSMTSGYSPVRLSTYDLPVYKDYLDVTKLDLTTYAGKRQQVFIEVLKLAQYLSTKDYFFVSPAFNKSSKARQEVGNILKNVFGQTGTDGINKVFQDAYDATAY